MISQDVSKERSGTVIAVALTSQPPTAGFPLTYPLPSAGLPKPSWVSISQIRTLSVERLGERLGSVQLEDLDQIIAGLNEIVGN